MKDKIAREQIIKTNGRIGNIIGENKKTKL